MMTTITAAATATMLPTITPSLNPPPFIGPKNGTKTKKRYILIRGQLFSPCHVFRTKCVQNQKSFWRSSQNQIIL
jgi:hypothetical protein